MKTIFFQFLLLVFFLLACAGGKYHLTPEAQAIKDRLDEISDVEKIELMPGTPYHTPAFIFTSPQPGPHILILGGTHGNEPAGYEAALRLLAELQKTPLKKGKLILIPMANRVADEIYNRRVPVPEGVDWERGNLNRCYPGKPDGYPMEQMAYQIQQLAIRNRVEVFIDLHEALRSHLKTDTESQKRGLGQTIIYYPNESSTWLVMTMLDEINDKIDDPNNHFSSLERPIKHSAAWWAGKYLNCAAFTFETARKLPLDQRIKNHLQLVHIVLREKGLL
ncbi:MAG TPA: hypothetical protein ENK14_00245 [Caldithrix sp.]|nr:hypothetical protein [Caldithrix sp.]